MWNVDAQIAGSKRQNGSAGQPAWRGRGRGGWSCHWCVTAGHPSPRAAALLAHRLKFIEKSPRRNCVFRPRPRQAGWGATDLDPRPRARTPGRPVCRVHVASVGRCAASGRQMRLHGRRAGRRHAGTTRMERRSQYLPCAGRACSNSYSQKLVAVCDDLSTPYACARQRCVSDPGHIHRSSA
jgi:hypothetical protein